MDWSDPIVRFIIVVVATSVGFGGFALWRARSIRVVEGKRELWPEALWSGNTTLVYFSGPNCSQCVAQERIVDAVGHTRPGVDIRKFDASVDTEVAGLLGVLTVPTTVVISEAGEVVARNGRLVSESGLADQLAVAGAPSRGVA